MTSKKISGQLEGIASAEDFASSSAELTEEWSAAEVGVECIEPILRFMEEHPKLDYGSPGPLVYFVEELYLKGHKAYEKQLIESVNRMPTIMTVWMLNRVLNGTEEPAKRQGLICELRQAATNPKADHAIVELVREFLDG